MDKKHYLAASCNTGIDDIIYENKSKAPPPSDSGWPESKNMAQCPNSGLYSHRSLISVRSGLRMCIPHRRVEAFPSHNKSRSPKYFNEIEISAWKISRYISIIQ